MDLPVMPPVKPMLARAGTLKQALSLWMDTGQLESRWDAWLHPGTSKVRVEDVAQRADRRKDGAVSAGADQRLSRAHLGLPALLG